MSGGGGSSSDSGGGNDMQVSGAEAFYSSEPGISTAADTRISAQRVHICVHLENTRFHHLGSCSTICLSESNALARKCANAKNWPSILDHWTSFNITHVITCRPFAYSYVVIVNKASFKICDGKKFGS